MIHHVRVLLQADFREIVGKREIVEKIDSDSTLKNILDKLAETYGKDFHQLVDSETDSISLEFLVSVNGRIARDTNTKLNSGDIVVITIPAGGG
jgi:MoaD family protein